MNNKSNIVVIPVDNRPVNYTLADSVGALNVGINIILPPREFMGGLKTSAGIEKILLWLEKVVLQNKTDFIICALDTIAYGGLIPSRRCEDQQEVIFSRLRKFRKIIEPLKSRVFAFSSIMRISNSNDNEEEKTYWDKYGKLIFKYSCLRHKQELNPDNSELKAEFQEVKSLIPLQVIVNYLKIRQRRFFVNKTYLNRLKENTFDFLVYGKDDTATVGLNIQEAELLQGEINSKNLEKKAVLHTGSDEIITMLVTRAITEIFREKISVFPLFSTLTGADAVPCYEDQPLSKSVEKHFNICGVKPAQSKIEADMLILLHTPDEKQNDLALQVFLEPENTQAVNFCLEFIKNNDKPIMLADVRNANGSDNLLAERLFLENIDLKKLYGYAAWNTAANSIGSVLATGICRYIAEKQGNFRQENFNRLMFVRFADDWAYQGIARQVIRAASDQADEVLLNKELIPLIERIASEFGINSDRVVVSFPWGRTFEVEINLL